LFIFLDKLVLASSGEEVLFTDSELEPELDIKVCGSCRIYHYCLIIPFVWSYFILILRLSGF